MGAKYREGIGQALDYADQTGDVTGLVLLVGGEDDEAGVERARTIVEEFGLPIRVWAEDTR